MALMMVALYIAVSLALVSASGRNLAAGTAAAEGSLPPPAH